MGEETGEEVKMEGGGGEELGQESGEEVPGADQVSSLPAALTPSRYAWLFLA